MQASEVASDVGVRRRVSSTRPRTLPTSRLRSGTVCLRRALPRRERPSGRLRREHARQRRAFPLSGRTNRGDRWTYRSVLSIWRTFATGRGSSRSSRKGSRLRLRTRQGAFHLRLGRVLESKFLAGVKALKHFQDAYKLNPALGESLEAARSVYWDLGKLNMVQKLLELELNAGSRKATTRASCSSSSATCSATWATTRRRRATYARALGDERRAERGGAARASRTCRPRAATWQAHVERPRRRGDRRIARAALPPVSPARVARRASLRARRRRRAARARVRR